MCIGAGMILVFQAIQTYVIDAFTLHAASGTPSSANFFLYKYSNRLLVFLKKIALAATSCLRALAGFGFPLFAPAMFAKLGYGKGDTILACLSIILGCPAYVLGTLLKLFCY